jgi:hypothetical protein
MIRTRSLAALVFAFAVVFAMHTRAASRLGENLDHFLQVAGATCDNNFQFEELASSFRADCYCDSEECYNYLWADQYCLDFDYACWEYCWGGNRCGTSPTTYCDGGDALCVCYSCD